jgi:hypothetical protein
VNRSLVLVLALVAGATIATTPASAAKKPPKPKPFKGSQSFTDTTPDPTASVPGGYAGCDSSLPAQYPREAGIQVKIPAAGKFKVDLNNVLDWAVDIRDSKGNVLSSSDGDQPQVVEGTSTRIKKAGTYTIVPCNLGGEPTVTVSWSYTP